MLLFLRLSSNFFKSILIHYNSKLSQALKTFMWEIFLFLWKQHTFFPLTGLQAHSQSVDVPPYIRTRNNDSTAYPGQQTVTCELRLPVAENKAGEYQFQVEITPNITSGNHSVFATTPTVNLGNVFEVKEECLKVSYLFLHCCPFMTSQ